MDVKWDFTPAFVQDFSRFPFAENNSIWFLNPMAILSPSEIVIQVGVASRDAVKTSLPSGLCFVSFLSPIV